MFFPGWKRKKAIMQNTEKMWERRRGKKAILTIEVRLRRGNPSGNMENFCFFTKEKNLAQEAIKMLQARKSFQDALKNLFVCASARREMQGGKSLLVMGELQKVG